MKHENSNASTATTTSSSATTPPTPEINGNIPNNNNISYQENFNNYQQPSTMPQSTQLSAQPSLMSPHHAPQPAELSSQQQHQASTIIPPAVNDMWNSVPSQQHYYSQQQIGAYPATATADLTNNNQQQATMPLQQQQHHTPVAINGDYMSYAEQPPYAQQVQASATTPPTIPNHYETWVSCMIIIDSNMHDSSCTLLYF